MELQGHVSYSRLESNLIEMYAHWWHWYVNAGHERKALWEMKAKEGAKRLCWSIHMESNCRENLRSAGFACREFKVDGNRDTQAGISVVGSHHWREQICTAGIYTCALSPNLCLHLHVYSSAHLPWLTYAHVSSLLLSISIQNFCTCWYSTLKNTICFYIVPDHSSEYFCIHLRTQVPGTCPFHLGIQV